MKKVRPRCEDEREKDHETDGAQKCQNLRTKGRQQTAHQHNIKPKFKHQS